MILTNDEIIEKCGKHCPSCNRKTLLPFSCEWTCLVCGHEYYKTKT